MDRGKLISAALLLTIAGILLIMPPLTLLFQWQQRIFGVPVLIIYIFVVWIGLVAGTRALAHRMPPDTPPDDPGGGR